MSQQIEYIDYDETLHVYQRMIETSNGGFAGVRDEGGIRAALEFIQNDLYYPSFAEKLTTLVYQFCAGHYFNDGNKRIALVVGMYFLHKNNYLWHACQFMARMEAIVYHVAASHIDKDLLLRIIVCFMNGEDYDESLQIDLMNAINSGDLGVLGEDYE